MNFIHEALRDVLYNLISNSKIDLEENVICNYRTGYDLGLKDKDYALIRGPEILLTCNVLGYYGQAFTVAPRNYRGKLLDVFKMDLSSIYNRGIFYAILNALLRKIGIINRSCHCTGNEAELCGKVLVNHIVEKHGLGIRILHIGYHPSHVHELYHVFRDNLLITDLREDIIWKIKNGRTIYDGTGNDVYIRNVDVVLVTGSSIINDTFWNIISSSIIGNAKVIMYGITGLGASRLIQKLIPIKIETFCPFSK